jgi:hypothetical protein
MGDSLIRRKIIAVDFDGCLVENAFPKVGKWKVDDNGTKIVDKVKYLQEEENWFVILWTCREGKLLTEAIEACEKEGLKLHGDYGTANDEAPWIKRDFHIDMEETKAVVEKGRCGIKIFANVYLDDLSLNVNDF